MKTIQHSTLLELARFSGTPCVSIYLPLRRTVPDIAADALELRNLLKSARRHLLDSNVQSLRVEEIVAPGNDLLDTIDSWHGHPAALALFLAPDFFRSYELPDGFESHVVVDSRFFISPLVQAAGSDSRFLFLALTKESVRLFEGVHRRLREIPLHGVATSLHEYLRFTDAERQLQLHSGGRPSGRIEPGHQGAIFHGNGSAAEHVKQELSEHFRRIDDKVIEATGHDSAPLVLGGVEYLTSIYRKSTRYGGRILGEIRGNLDHWSPAQLYDASSQLAEPWFQRPRIGALEKLHTLMGTGLASMSAQEILTAAEAGRVESLILAADGDSGRPGTEERRRPGQLANAAVVATLTHGGAVYRSTPGEIDLPDGIAAVFRY
jgi:hypothetical protein